MEKANDNNYPLNGYRIIDLGTAWAGPMTTQLLADMGAEVIKVETKTRLDGLRIGRPVVGDDIAGGDEGKWPDMQPSFHGLNRNKLSVTVNLKQTKGLSLVLELVKKSHVVCDNFSPGVMARNGLDYEALRKVRPDIIAISLSGAGQYGPWKEATLYAGSILALSGVGGLLGYQGQPPLGMTALAFGDANASIHAAFAVLAALFHHSQTGEGLFIDLSESRAASSLLGEAFMDYFMNGRIARPEGNSHRYMVPHGNYPCRGNDKWVSIAVAGDQEWCSLVKAMGEPRWAADERFEDSLSRWKHRAELEKLIASWTVNFTPYEVMAKLQEAGVAAVPVMNVEDQYFDPHFRELRTHIEIEHPLVGLEVLYGIPWRIGGVPRRIRRPAPNLGEHNHYVFGELLGLSDEEIRTLMKEKVIY